MANDVIQIGCKIEMRIVDRRSIQTVFSEPDVYVSQFLQWSDNNVASIAIPTFKGHLVPLRVDDVYDLQFVTRGGLYRCRGQIIKRSKNGGNIATADVKFISALEKFQRRQFYRMNCIISMNYSVLNDVQKELYKEKKRCLSLEQKLQIEKKLENQEMEFQKAIVLDISGGGMRFNSPVQQEAGDVCLLQPALPEAVRKRIPFLFGRIISSRRIPNRDPITFDNRVEFVEISSSEQEQIITYIFKEERDKRKRETELK
ncbi:MAG: flagellar brake protein [Lachnospiraceae bacterium]|nr:flagellar brake protein [Lachnospiraceae bacterium]